MSDKTAIEWTDATWNPVRGCSRVSEGCRNCYAESVAARFSGPGMPYEGLARSTPSGPRWTGKVTVVNRHLRDPLRWKRPRRVFVNSMSDLFHEQLSDLAIAAVFAVMESAPQHTFQVLTKRPERMRRLLSNPQFYAGLVRKAGYDVVRPGPHGYDARNPGWPMPNVWLGASVENQAAADERIPLLLQTPAAVRFLSCEPLLGPINLLLEGFDEATAQSEDVPRLREGVHAGQGAPAIRESDLQGPRAGTSVSGRAGRAHHPRIGWVIAGGESGPGARPMHPAWARSLRDQCAAAGVAFFWKQWGEWAPREWGELVRLPQPDSTSRIGYFNGEHRFIPGGSAEGFQNMVRVGKKRAGRELDGRTWDDFPRAHS